MKNYIKIYDNVLNLKTLSNFLRFINTVDFQDARVGDGVVNKKIRNTTDYSLNQFNNSFTNVHWHNYLYFIFNNYFKEYAKDYKHLEWKGLETIAVLKYDINGFYKEHVDHFSSQPITLSGIFLLNNDYEGGELCFGLEDKLEVEIKPNRFIVWPSNFLFPHQVKPVCKGTRYSIVTWAI